MRYSAFGATGLTVSCLGFGASPLGNEFGSADAGECERAVHCAVDLGINYFDVAPYYGRTLAEERLGAALDGRRHRVVLATKCGRDDFDRFDFSAARVRSSVEESLRRLRTDVIDVFQAHDIEYGDGRQIIAETVPELRRLQQEGKVRFIGITGLQLRMLRAAAEIAPVDTVLSYCRYNLLIDDMDALLTPWARSHGVALINASPLHMGILTEQGPPAWHPAPRQAREAGARVVALCAERGLDAPALALQFCLAHPAVATTLMGMATQEQVERNARAASVRADSEVLAAIRSAAGGGHGLAWPSGRPENHDYQQYATD